MGAFYLFLLLIALARAVSTILHGSGKSILCIPDLREKKLFSYLPLSMILAVRFSCKVLIMLRYLNVFDVEKLNFVKFSESTDNGHVVFFPHPVNLVYYIDWFSCVLNHSYISEINPLVIIYNPFNMLLILLRIFAVVVFRVIDMQFPFLAGSSSGFGIRVIMPASEWVSVPPSISWKNLRDWY